MTRRLALAIALGAAVLLAAWPAIAGDNAALDSTTSTVASGGAVGILGMLWMLVRQASAFTDRVTKHFEAEEKTLVAIAKALERHERRAEIEARAEQIARDNTGPISVVEHREARPRPV